MTSLQKGVLTLIKSALTGRPLTLPQDFSLEEAKKVIINHQIVGLATEGAALCGLDKNTPAMQELFLRAYRLLAYSEKQAKALRQLLEEFSWQGIGHLCVKGSVLKSLYPRPELRVMGDADILIRKEQYAAITSIMTSQGFALEEETENVYAWKNPHLQVELHETLLDSTEQEYDYYKDLWDRAEKLAEHSYGLSKEEEYVFTFVHYTKHYRHGGIGLRQLTDLWLCRQKWTMDMGKVEKALRQLGLLAFWENTCRMLETWFADGPADEVTDFMTCYIFDAGSWGSAQQAAAATALYKIRKTGSGKKARISLFFSSLFPGISWMRRRYPVLNKAPVLLPVMWPVRWVDAALFRRKNIQAVRNKFTDSADEKVEQFRQTLEMVGLE